MFNLRSMGVVHTLRVSKFSKAPPITSRQLRRKEVNVRLIPAMFSLLGDTGDGFQKSVTTIQQQNGTEFHSTDHPAWQLPIQCSDFVNHISKFSAQSPGK